MGGFENWAQLALIGLLAATLWHAIRLQRAIGALRSERASMDDAIAGFDSGARQAEIGLAHLREAAERLANEMGPASSLKDDLAFLTQRGAQVADRLEALVRATRNIEPNAETFSQPAHRQQSGSAPIRSQAERDLLLALQGAR